MKIRTIAAALVLCTLLSLSGCASGSSGNQSSDRSKDDDTKTTTEEAEPEYYRELMVGDTAPDFTVELTNGDTFTLSDHNDEVVMINFWATWCPPCRGEMPDFERITNENPTGFTFVAINQCETKAMVDAFANENGYTFNIGYDPDGAVLNKYPTDGIPYTVIIKNGVVRRLFLGAPSPDPYEVYMTAIKECLAE